MQRVIKPANLKKNIISIAGLTIFFIFEAKNANDNNINWTTGEITGEKTQQNYVVNKQINI